MTAFKSECSERMLLSQILGTDKEVLVQMVTTARTRIEDEISAGDRTRLGEPVVVVTVEQWVE